MSNVLSWEPIQMTVSMFYGRLNNASPFHIDCDPVGQRPDVESISKRQGIIDTMLRGYDFGELKLRTLTDAVRKAAGFKYRSIDGGHRKRAIRDFIDGKFKTGKDTVANIKGKEIDISNLYYRELPDEVKEQFNDYKIRFTVYSDTMSDEQAGETFRRTNITTDVNHQEMLNSYEDNLVAKFVREISRPVVGLNNDYHPLFEYTSLLPENRKQRWFQKASLRLRDDEFVTRLLTMFNKVETNQANYLTSSNRDMEKYFEDVGTPIKGLWAKDAVVAKRHKKHLTEALEFMMSYAQAKRKNSKSLLTNQDFTLASRFYVYLIQTYSRNGFSVKDFEKFYVSIRTAMDRFVGSDESKLRVDTHSDDKGVRTVSECFKQYLTVHDDQRRSTQSIKWLLEEMDINDCGIIFLDKNRVFSAEMIEERWRANGKVCEIDGLPLSLDEAVGGHIIPHCDGGKTVRDNLMVIRKEHNTKMGSMNALVYKQIYNDTVELPATELKDLAA